jgi:hypothetical protein
MAKLKPARNRTPTRARTPVTFVQQAKATLKRVQFSRGVRRGPIMLSPKLTPAQRRALLRWIRSLPAALQSRLPQLKITAADGLYSVRRVVFIGESPLPLEDAQRDYTHAVSFIPERYVVLNADLFRRRIELGRILYHELCHFIWPRLGNPKRRRFEAHIAGELRDGVRGELGYSSEYRKENIKVATGRRHSTAANRKRKLEYVCESFCDTGSFVLLGRKRRKQHSEYSLSRRALRQRVDLWSELVLKPESGSRLR